MCLSIYKNICQSKQCGAWSVLPGTWLQLPFKRRGIPGLPHTVTDTQHLLVAKRACIHSLQHHLAEGYMVAQVNLSKSSVVQGLFFDEISRSHVKRRLRRGGHPCSEVTIKTAVRDHSSDKLQTKWLKRVQYAEETRWMTGAATQPPVTLKTHWQAEDVS